MFTFILFVSVKQMHEKHYKSEIYLSKYELPGIMI